MKTCVLGLLALIISNVNAQNMKDPQQTVTDLFIATDQENWQKVESSFAEEVLLDYSSMNGNPPATLTPSQIITAWKGILPGFEHTHHQVTNFKSKTAGRKAFVFCYGTASHYLENEAGNLWTVVGTYNFELEQLKNDAWQITSMKFNFKYQDGNTSLPEKAIEQQKRITTMNPDIAIKNKDSVKRFFQALENEDPDQLAALFAEKAIHINPYASGLFPEGAKGREGIRNYWAPVFPNFDGMKFPIQELYAMEDPSIVFVKYHGQISLKNDSGMYENQYYSTFKFNEVGLITEYVEIFNPIVAARAFGLTDQIK